MLVLKMVIPLYPTTHISTCTLTSIMVDTFIHVKPTKSTKIYQSIQKPKAIDYRGIVCSHFFRLWRILLPKEEHFQEILNNILHVLFDSQMFLQLSIKARFFKSPSNIWLWSPLIHSIFLIRKAYYISKKCIFKTLMETYYTSHLVEIYSSNWPLKFWHPSYLSIFMYFL